WRRGPATLTRRLPAAFAVGVPRDVGLGLESPGDLPWRCTLFDHADPTMTADGLPAALTLPARSRVDTAYRVVPTERGDVAFEPAEVRVRSRWGFWELLDRLGARETRRVYPDFAQVARYAWLAGGRRLPEDRGLQEMGIRT